MARPSVVDRSIGKQDVILHTVDKERRERDNKQQLTVRMRWKKKKKTWGIILNDNKKHNPK